MKLIQRIGYYLGGFSLGLIILTFFLNGKKTSCSYGPEARVIKNINSKKIVYSDNIKSLIYNKTIDSLTINQILRSGHINFSESYPRQEPCGVYSIKGSKNDQEVAITVRIVTV